MGKVPPPTVHRSWGQRGKARGLQHGSCAPHPHCKESGASLPPREHSGVKESGGKIQGRGGGWGTTLGGRRGGLDPMRGVPSRENFSKFHFCLKGSTHERRAKKWEWIWGQRVMQLQGSCMEKSIHFVFYVTSSPWAPALGGARHVWSRFASISTSTTTSVLKSLSHVRLFATLWTVAHQALPSMEFSRQEYWSR